MLYKPCKRCSSVMIPYDKLYCDSCEKIVKEQRAEQWKKRRKEYYKEYGRNRMDKDYQKLYHCKRWKQLRQSIIRNQMGLDVVGLLVTQSIYPSDIEPLVAHHIIPSKEIGKENFYDESNIIIISNQYHELVHLVYDCKEEYKNKLIKTLKELKEIEVKDLLNYIINQLEDKEIKYKIENIRESLIELFEIVE